MRVFQLLFILIVTIAFCHGQWTWLSGTHDQNTLVVRPGAPKIEQENSTVGGRLGGVAWHGKNNDIWLFGGTGSSSNFASVSIFSDVWHYSFDTGIWIWLGGGANGLPSNSTPYAPGARSAFVSFVENSESVLIFGGYAKLGYFGDIWRLTVDTANLTYTWTPIFGDETRDLPVDYQSANPTPGGRAFSGGWRDAQGNMWIFGGNAYHNSTSTVADSTNDLWMFNMTSLSWKFLGGPQNMRDPGHYSNDSLAWPAARNSHMTWSRNGEFWFFGGSLANGPNYNDVWKYANGMWTWVAGDDPSLKKLGRYGTKGIGTYYTVPGGRGEGTLWVDSRGLVWIFGGIGVNEQSATGDLQDVWVFNMTSKVFSWVDGTSILEYKANYSAMGVYSTATPSARAGHFCVPINDSFIWFYGGAQLNVYYNFYADMFSLNSTAITHQENYTMIAPAPMPTTTGSLQSSIVSPSGKSSNTAAIAAGVVVPLAVLAITGVVVFLIWKKRKEQKQNENVDMEKLERKDSQYGALSDLSKYKQLSGIVIKDLLGVGNFGEVFRGLWNTTPVALKKLKDQAQFAAFQKEAELLCSLKNPYIVQYYGTYVDNNRFQYIVTELMTKGDAREFLVKNTHLNVKELTQMALEAAEGMAFIHSQNIIHRDLALRNLLVTESSGRLEVKVSDFGMAKMIEGQDSYYKSESNHHPIKWCSIETLKYGKYTIQSDVWAYGILLWELFSYGAVPYPGLTNVEAAEKVLEGYRMPNPENCPNEIFKIMSKCWNETPKERPSMDQIVLEIKSILKTL